MNIRPSLPCCPPVPAPTCEAYDATAGSRPTMSFSFSCSAAIRANDESCAPSLMPMISPTSWVGKKPFGIATNRNPVIVTVAMNTSSVRKRKRSATSSVAR